MPNIKQIEAFYWSSQLGSFIAAAERLNTTQSNISKRIQDLEYTLGVELFDRSRRAIRITAKGEELLKRSKTLLVAHQAIRQIGSSDALISGPFHFGVTEAVALTWLAPFFSAIQTAYPELVPISSVDSSANLNQMLLDRKIDLAIATERNLDPDLIRIPLATARRVWVASPRLIPHDRELTVAELAELPMLGHGEGIAHRNLVSLHLRSLGVTPRIVCSCTNMSALAKMTMDGIGITYLHEDVFREDIDAGRLKVVNAGVEVPSIAYVAAYRNDVISPIAEQIGRKAIGLCRFEVTRSAASP